MKLEFDVQACITHFTIAYIRIILCAKCVKLTDFILCCSALTNGSSFSACLKDAVSFVDKYMVDVKELSSAEIYIFSYFFDRAKDADIIGNKKSPKHFTGAFNIPVFLICVCLSFMWYYCSKHIF